MISDKDIANIELYLSGLMSQKERELFEQELVSRPELNEELILEQTINASVIENGAIEFGEDIKKEFNRLNKRKRIIVTSFTTIIAIAGIVSAIMFFQKRNEPNNLKLPNITPEKGEQTDKKDTTKVRTKKTNSKTQNQKFKKKIHHFDSLTTEFVDTIPNNEIAIESTEKDFHVDQVKDTTVVEKDTALLENTNNNPCEGVNIQFEVSVIHTCQNEAGGVLNVIKITGGTSPYLLKLNEDVWSNKMKYKYLQAGDYNLKIKDAKGCMSQVSDSEIQEKYCYKPPKGFNPDYETWQYEGDYESDVSMVIRNKSGRVVFQTKGTGVIEWNGIDNNGQKVPKGLYLYTIEGTEIVNGTVTVVY